MRRFEDEVSLPVDEGALAARVTSPEEEHEMFALLGELRHDGVGEHLPSLALM